VLFADEIGSLHERLGMFFGFKHRYREAPFALVIASALTYGLLVLERRRHLVGSTARLIALGFAFFVFAGAQEKIESRLVAAPWMDATRTVIEEGSELAGTFLFLLAGMRARRTGSHEPLGTLADWRSLSWVVALAVLCSGPVLFYRNQWTFEQLRLPKLGDFGVVIPVTFFTCAAVAAALQAMSKRQPTRAWWGLATVLTGLSIAAATHLHRYLLGYVSWRYDLDLIAGLPLLAWAMLGIPELRRPTVYVGFLVLALTVPLSVFIIGSPMVSLINLYLAGVGSAAAVLLAAPLTARQSMTVNRRTVVIPGATTRTR
jgi:hypothetical protein